MGINWARSDLTGRATICLGVIINCLKVTLTSELGIQECVVCYVRRLLSFDLDDLMCVDFVST